MRLKLRYKSPNARVSMSRDHGHLDANGAIIHSDRRPGPG